MNHSLKRLIARSPRLDEVLRRIYVRILYPSRREAGFTHWLNERTRLYTPWQWAGVPAEAGDLFFGYYDKTPWSPNEDKMLFHFRKRTRDPKVEILVFNRQRGNCTRVGSSRTWNYQQGAMAQWLPGQGDDSVIYNDIQDGQFVSRIIRTDGKEESVIGFPVQAVHPTGSEFMSLNYRRLWKLRHDYGYSVSASNFKSDQPLDRDGLWRVELPSGKSKLVVSLAELMTISPRPEMNARRTKINHVMYSPSGKRCIFLHRWFHEGVKFHRAYCINSDGSGLKLVLESPMISHYFWRDDDHLIVYGSYGSGKQGYFDLNVQTGDTLPIENGVLDSFGDGHPSYSSDRKWIATDNYPNSRLQQDLIVHSVGSSTPVIVGRFLHPARFYGYSRCDLHPRWGPSASFLSFDSAFSGRRGSYLLDVSRILNPSTYSENFSKENK